MVVVVVVVYIASISRLDRKTPRCKSVWVADAVTGNVDDDDDDVWK